MEALAGREFEFSNQDFELLARFIKERVGITLAEHKKQMVYSRLTKRLRVLQFQTFGEYCQYVFGEDGQAEMNELINALTTNHTSFFREKHHFDFLANVLKAKVESQPAHKRLRIWSAGCSLGMEAYSIMMTLWATLRDPSRWDIKLLATDIDTNILERAAAARYTPDQIQGIPPAFLKRFLIEHRDGYEVIPELREPTRFNKLNFNDATWPVKQPFDIIFCRNVMIYFDKEMQRRVVAKFSTLLPKGGYLIIGHSENLFTVSDDFEAVGKTIYCKK